MGSEQKDPEEASFTILDIKKNHSKSFVDRQNGFLGIASDEMRRGIVQTVLSRIYPLKIKIKSTPKI